MISLLLINFFILTGKLTQKSGFLSYGEVIIKENIPFNEIYLFLPSISDLLQFREIWSTNTKMG
jgi:hypothetical protein